MKKRIQGLIAGLLLGAVLTGTTVFAANTISLHGVLMEGISIVLDGQKVNPTDVNGNKVEPLIYNGTTYLPVRAVATALGKAVYWDGPTYTVYLGDMDGKLEYPTKELNIADRISSKSMYKSTELTDNLGNTYLRAIHTGTTSNSECEFLLNMQYSKFKGTIYVENGTKQEGTVRVSFVTDGKTVYTTSMTKTSGPVHFDVNITGCYDFEIVFESNSDSVSCDWVHIADAGFYQ